MPPEDKDQNCTNQSNFQVKGSTCAEGFTGSLQRIDLPALSWRMARQQRSRWSLKIMLRHSTGQA